MDTYGCKIKEAEPFLMVRRSSRSAKCWGRGVSAAEQLLITWSLRVNMAASVQFPCSATTGEMKHYMVYTEMNGLSM